MQEVTSGSASGIFNYGAQHAQQKRHLQEGRGEQGLQAVGNSLQRLPAPELEHQLQLALLGVWVHAPRLVQLFPLSLCEVPLEPSSKALALPIQRPAALKYRHMSGHVRDSASCTSSATRRETLLSVTVRFAGAELGRQRSCHGIVSSPQLWSTGSDTSLPASI